MLKSICLLFLLLLQTATVSASELDVETFVNALIPVAKGISSTQSGEFLKDAGKGRKQNLSRLLDEELRYYEEVDLSFKAEAQANPQTVVMGGSPAFNGKGGFVVWKNDVFPSDFFVRHHQAFDNRGAVEVLLENLKKQPWFEWDGARYGFHDSGAGPQLLDMLLSGKGQPAKVSLYRGTTDYEALLFTLYQNAAANQLPTDWRNQLQAAYNKIIRHAQVTLNSYKELPADVRDDKELESKQQALERTTKTGEDLTALQTKSEDTQTILRKSLTLLMKQGTFFGIFTTPDRERAVEFSKGQVIELQIPTKALMEAVESGAGYIGFESFQVDQSHYMPSIEIALFSGSDEKKSAALMDLILQNFAGSKAEKPSDTFN